MADPKVISEREQWFLDRIGKVIWRNNYCNCPVCMKIYNEGLFVTERNQAMYCYDAETEYTAEGNPLRYFDTKNERDAWKQALSTQK